VRQLRIAVDGGARDRQHRGDPDIGGSIAGRRDLGRMSVTSAGRGRNRLRSIRSYRPFRARIIAIDIANAPKKVKTAAK
jgi:hypothetical protein